MKTTALLLTLAFALLFSTGCPGGGSSGVIDLATEALKGINYNGNSFGAETPTPTPTASATPTATPNTSPPVITWEPASVLTGSGSDVLVYVGTDPTNVACQWFIGSSGTTNSPILGATALSYTFTNVVLGTTFWVRVSNAYGATNSVTASITVTP